MEWHWGALHGGGLAPQRKGGTGEGDNFYSFAALHHPHQRTQPTVAATSVMLNQGGQDGANINKRVSLVTERRLLVEG